MHNQNIASVQRSQLFNAMIHLHLFSFIRRLYLRFRTVLIVFCGSLYCIAYTRLLYENLFK